MNYLLLWKPFTESLSLSPRRRPCVHIFYWSPTPVSLVCSSMEVGVCAEAYQGGEPLRHINSAFMTFEVLDSDRKQKTLPRIRPEPVVSFIRALLLCERREKKDNLL